MRACERRPSDCWDWITPDDVVRHALAAFYAASRHVESSDGPWWEDGQPWSSRADFRDALAGMFMQRINVFALAQGVDGDSGSSWPALPSGAGHSPASAAGASIAHGCAAFDQAVGTRAQKASGAPKGTPDNRPFSRP